MPRASVLAVDFPTLAPPVAPLPVTATPTNEKQRHEGPMLCQAPENVLVDAEYGHHRGFDGPSIGFPIVWTGGHGEGQYVGFAVGLGATWKRVTSKLPERWAAAASATTSRAARCTAAPTSSTNATCRP